MKIFTTMTLMAALAVAPAFAQNNFAVRATVPFDFVVGKAVLPAGQYDVKAGAGSETLLVREREGDASAFVITSPAVAPHADEISLVFRTIGDTHYLQTVRSSAGARDLSNSGPAKGGMVHVIKAAIVRSADRLTTSKTVVSSSSSKVSLRERPRTGRTPRAWTQFFV